MDQYILHLGQVCISYKGMEKWLNKFENEQFTCIDFWHFGFNIYQDKLYKSMDQLSIQYNDIYSLLAYQLLWYHYPINLNDYQTSRNIYEHYELLKWCANQENYEDIKNYIQTFYNSWKQWIEDGTYDYENFKYKDEVNEYFEKVQKYI